MNDVEADVMAFIFSTLYRNKADYSQKIALSFKTMSGEDRSIILPPNYSLQAGITPVGRFGGKHCTKVEAEKITDGDEEATIRSIISSGKFDRLKGMASAALKCLRYLLRDIAVVKRRIDTVEREFSPLVMKAFEAELNCLKARVASLEELEGINPFEELERINPCHEA